MLKFDVTVACAALGDCPSVYDYTPTESGYELMIVEPEDRVLLLESKARQLVLVTRALAKGSSDDIPGDDLTDLLEAYTLLRQHLGNYIDRLGLDRIPLNSDAPAAQAVA